MIQALINNQWETISTESLQLGADTFAFETGLYETFRTLDFKPVFLEPHLDRLFRSVKLTGLTIHYKRGEILEMVETVIANFDDPNQRTRILAVPDKLILYTSSLNLDPVIYNGVSAITVKGTRETPNVKTTNYKVCYDAWQLAESKKCFEAILIDKDGSVLEGSRSNIFWAKTGKLYTREGGVLPGVTRQTILSQSPFPVKFGQLNQDEFETVDELFLTNSGSGVVPIIQVNEQTIGDGSIGEKTSQLVSQYNDWMHADFKQ